MNSKYLILGLLMASPIYVQAIYHPPGPIHLKKSNGNSENLPQIQRETFYLDIESLEELNNNKDRLNESDLLMLFNEKKLYKTTKNTDYYEIDVQEYRNFRIYDINSETKKNDAPPLFFVIDRFEGSHIIEYYIVNPSSIRDEYNTVNELMIENLKTDGFVFNGENVEGIYATTLSFINEKKTITDFHFNGEYATYLDILKEYKKIK